METSLYRFAAGSRQVMARTTLSLVADRIFYPQE